MFSQTVIVSIKTWSLNNKSYSLCHPRNYKTFQRTTYIRYSHFQHENLFQGYRSSKIRVTFTPQWLHVGQKGWQDILWWSTLCRSPYSNIHILFHILLLKGLIKVKSELKRYVYGYIYSLRSFFSELMLKVLVVLWNFLFFYIINLIGK